MTQGETRAPRSPRLSVAALGTLGVRSASLGFSFLATVLLARVLGADGYGLFAWATAWALTLQIVCALGFDVLAIREVSAALVRHDDSSIRGLLRYGRRVSGAIALVAGLTVIGSALLLLDDDRARAITIGLAVLPLMSLTLVRQGVTQGLGHVALGRMPEDLVRPALLLIFSIGLTVFLADKATADMALAAQGLAIAIAFVVGNFVLARVMSGAVGAAEPRPGWWRWTKQAAPLAIAGSTQVLLAQLGVILVGLLASNVDVAVYAVATRIALLVGLPEFAVNTAFLPVAARLHAQRAPDELRRQATMIALVGLLGTLVAAIVPMVAPDLILSAFGIDEAGAALTVQLVCGAWIVSAVAGQNGAVLTMTGHMRPVVRSVVAAVFLNGALNVVLVPAYGAVGAAWAWLVTLAIWNFVLAFQARRALGFWCSPLAGIKPTISWARDRRQNASRNGATS